jgi:hypothetical protein
VSAGFTPGPWRRSRKSGAPYIISEGDNGQTVARVTEFTRDFVAEQVANANLIAAAPELYEALDAIVAAIEPTLNAAVEAGYPNEESVARMNAAKAALTKARGEDL